MNPPDQHIFAITGANNLGDLVGHTDTRPLFTYSFSFTRGKYQIIRFPGSNFTFAEDINDKGVIVGWYIDRGSLVRGYVLMNGQYFTVDYPGATVTQVLGINNLGQLVGTYSGVKSGYQGFVTSPITEAVFR
jgi:uncharacterized membrane protein